MNAGMGVMGVMNRADITGAKNLDIMIVKSISIYFENNAGVIVNVKRDEGFGEHVTSEPRANATNSGVAHTAEQLRVTFGYVQRANGSVEHQEIHTVVISTQHSEHLKTVRSKEVAGYSGPGAN